jgi:hypothetical protein
MLCMERGLGWMRLMRMLMRVSLGIVLLRSGMYAKFGGFAGIIYTAEGAFVGCMCYYINSRSPNYIIPSLDPLVTLNW